MRKKAVLAHEIISPEFQKTQNLLCNRNGRIPSTHMFLIDHEYNLPSYSTEHLSSSTPHAEIPGALIASRTKPCAHSRARRSLLLLVLVAGKDNRRDLI
ncbi:hypothetical protein T310_6868 [Rasamsonia emersonii CBS 393.64]|uniref:Uncharacterized protein n=1 Tax=Rasamsonia emersonii (strain ATCC 16479 / CBS 393.64 / IMI 116815) TaxID=1408163 RepID=A0A0F4YLT0_RASE3|nr:hypothetical protein T310_6868 [Rasamsonia emersonii CBS 393.64]KKA19169.1 hypothetical protein T310_6868 [Rasamsonia emersonii CBS 393.64]